MCPVGQTLHLILYRWERKIPLCSSQEGPNKNRGEIYGAQSQGKGLGVWKGQAWRTD